MKTILLRVSPQVARSLYFYLSDSKLLKYSSKLLINPKDSFWIQKLAIKLQISLPHKVRPDYDSLFVQYKKIVILEERGFLDDAFLILDLGSETRRVLEPIIRDYKPLEKANRTLRIDLYRLVLGQGHPETFRILAYQTGRKDLDVIYRRPGLYHHSERPRLENLEVLYELVDNKEYLLYDLSKLPWDRSEEAQIKFILERSFEKRLILKNITKGTTDPQFLIFLLRGSIDRPILIKSFDRFVASRPRDIRGFKELLGALGNKIPHRSLGKKGPYPSRFLEVLIEEGLSTVVNFESQLRFKRNFEETSKYFGENLRLWYKGSVKKYLKSEFNDLLEIWESRGKSFKLNLNLYLLLGPHFTNFQIRELLGISKSTKIPKNLEKALQERFRELEVKKRSKRDD